ncbi:MAG TPA: glycosyltransferase family A protein, partial [Candidatus Sabulitectum sp.]|nr:glycosyltransferase family A protein [Candidatus Sabulitectum sp.]
MRPWSAVRLSLSVEYIQPFTRCRPGKHRRLVELALPVKISVIIPAWNAGATLGHCLDSLKEQSRKPFEILLVDDGSTDDTRRLAE